MISPFSSKPIKDNESVYALVRIIVGFLMLYHGLEVFDSKLMLEYSHWDKFKNLPYSLSLIYLGKGLEFITGLFFILGLFTRVAAILMLINMLFICFYVGNGKFWYQDQHPFLFSIIAILYFANGSGKWSIDQFLTKRKAK